MDRENSRILFASINGLSPIYSPRGTNKAIISSLSIRNSMPGPQLDVFNCVPISSRPIPFFFRFKSRYGSNTFPPDPGLSAAGLTNFTRRARGDAFPANEKRFPRSGRDHPWGGGAREVGHARASLSFPPPPLPRGKDELKENIALLFQSREFSNSSDYHRPRFDPWTGGAD